MASVLVYKPVVLKDQKERARLHLQKSQRGIFSTCNVHFLSASFRKVRRDWKKLHHCCMTSLQIGMYAAQISPTLQQIQVIRTKPICKMYTLTDRRTWRAWGNWTSILLLPRSIDCGSQQTEEESQVLLKSAQASWNSYMDPWNMFAIP